MQIIIIAALTDNYVIGINNKLPWHLPADLKHFHEITSGKPVIMGRKTYESIGKILPGRRNIILSHNKRFKCKECEVYDSFKKAFAALKNCQEVFIIGGAKLFKKALPLTEKMYLTFVHDNFEGDTYFPKWNTDEWQEIQRRDFKSDEKNNCADNYRDKNYYEAELILLCLLAYY